MLKRFIPNTRQFSKWNLPNKVTYISGVVGLISFSIGIISSSLLGVEKYIDDYIFSSLSIEKKYYENNLTKKYDGHEREIDKIFYPPN
ncbi:hypothetical protein [Sulfurimonas sp.]|uniref:hypothetical protein n=1 Tax=Sulfurimonas sp. TaxID=2022749 RepID=UPI002AB0F14A|nr:hypothetical protein [Sulfurimonas sp.]